MTWNRFCQEYADRECANVANACLFPEPDCQINRQAACTVSANQQMTLQPPHSFNPANATPCLNKVSQVFSAIAHNVVITGRDYMSMVDACDRVFQGSAKANQRCDQDSDCEKQLTCDSKGYCGTAKQVGIGAGCGNVGETCPQGQYCALVGTLNICSPRAVIGTGCDVNTPCMENLRCASGVCLERLPIGVDCLSNDECESEFCEPFAGKCSEDVRFSAGSPACLTYQGQTSTPTRSTPTTTGNDASTPPATTNPAASDASTAPASSDASSN